jgi:ABC-2 type transport system permease protein
MILRIARKEALETFRDGRFRVIAVAIIALLAVSLGLGWKRYSDVSRQHEAGRKATRENWLTQGEKNPHSAAHYGVYAFKPRTPLSFIDNGVDPYAGVSVWLEAHKQNDFKYKPAQDSNTLARFGELTGAAVMQILVPLLIILLSFSAFAGEREQGTLRQLLSLGLKRGDLALGKALGLAGSLGTVLIPAAVLGAAVMVFLGDSQVLPDTAARVSLLALFYVLYFAAILGTSLAVSARSKSGRVALLSLLGFWMVNCLVAPRALTDLARYVQPTPSAFEFAKIVEHDLETGVNGDSSAAQRTRELQQRLLKQYGVDSIEKLPVSYRGVSLQEGEEHGYEVFDKRYSELWDGFERQNAVRQAGGIIAPMLPMRSLSMALAGTDFAQHRDFAVAAEGYRRSFIKMINEDITKNAVGKDLYVRGDDLWRTIPEFQYVAPGVAAVLRGQMPSIVLLALWTAMASFAAWWFARRIEAV